MMRAMLAVLLMPVVFAALSAAPTRSSQAAGPATLVPAQDPFPEATGKAPLLKVCGNCHSPQTVIQTLRTRQEWSDVIDQMARFGAEASDQEFDQILAYLVRHFSPIKVNTATAKDLETLLEVPGGVAEAMVAYRLEKGEFKTIDDLKKVPGLESARIEAVKTRLVF